MPYITPDNLPTSVVCRALLIPDDPIWLAIVNGAITELLRESNFEQTTGLTPAQVTARFDEMYIEYTKGCAVAVEIGDLKMMAANLGDHNGWLLCDGRHLSRTEYAELFAEIGTTWGAGLNSTQFTIPQGQNNMVRGAADGSDVGVYAGQDSIVITNENLPKRTLYTVPTGSGVSPILPATVHLAERVADAAAMVIIPQHFKINYYIFSGVVNG